MNLPIGSALPLEVKAALQKAGIRSPCIVAVVRDGCGACDDALPLLEDALPLALGDEVPALFLAQEDAEETEKLRERLSPSLTYAPDPEPYPLSVVLGPEFTPTLYRVEGETVVDVVEGFDPEGFQRLLKDLCVALGKEPFELYAPGEPRPRFRPG
ncbi:MAG: hypothetical protein AB2A00_20425 [Myxococcota bacterium]